MTLFWSRVKAASFLFVLLLTVLFTGSSVVLAEGPKLTQVAGSELQNAFQDKKPYTLRMLYTDPSGDEISKSKAVLIDESPSGTNRITATSITGDTRTGAVVEWHVNGFEPGSHKAHFEVMPPTGTAAVRYPAEATEFHSFVVENLTTKWIILGVGSLLCFLAVPAVVFFLSRTMNPRGDSSQAARIGLLIGVLCLIVLFIYLFLNVYGPLVFAAVLLGLLALPILMTRRR